MDWEKLYRIADLNCGDLLKASLMNQAEPDLKINLLYLRAPERQAEKVAEHLQNKGVPQLAAFREDHIKHGRPTFESIDPVQELRNRQLAAARSAPRIPALAYDPPPSEQKVNIVQKVEPSDAPAVQVVLLENNEAGEGEWITYKEAAELRGSSEAAISLLVKNNSLEKRKEKGSPIKISRAAIMALRQNKRKAA